MADARKYRRCFICVYDFNLRELTGICNVHSRGGESEAMDTLKITAILCIPVFALLITASRHVPKFAPMSLMAGSLLVQLSVTCNTRFSWNL